MRQLKSASIFLATTLLIFANSWAQPTNNQSATGETSQQSSSKPANVSQNPDSQNQKQSQNQGQVSNQNQNQVPSQNQNQPQAQSQNQNTNLNATRANNSTADSSPSAAAPTPQTTSTSQTGSQTPAASTQPQNQPPSQARQQQQQQQPTPSQQSQAAEATPPPAAAPASESAQPTRQPAQSQQQPAPQTRPAPPTTIRSSRIAKKSERPKSAPRQSGSTTKRTTPQAAKPTSALTIGNNRMTSIVQDRVALERTELQRQAETVAEGFSAVEEARNAIGYINSRNLDRANSSLTTSLSKLERVLAEHPDMPLVPVATEVRVMDFVSDPKMVESVTQNARALVTEGRFQAARQLLRNFASEINLETTSLPMTTFPTTVREAGRLLKQGKAEEAKAALIGALNSLVISEKSVPLPVVKAQALVDEVNRGVIDRSMKKTDAQQFLQAATSQLQMAQTMGYGAGPQDLVVLQNSINQIQKSLNQNIDSRRMLARVRNDLENLKRRTL